MMISPYAWCVNLIRYTENSIHPHLRKGKQDTQARGGGVIQLISELGKGLALVVK